MEHESQVYTISDRWKGNRYSNSDNRVAENCPPTHCSNPLKGSGGLRKLVVSGPQEHESTVTHGDGWEKVIWKDAPRFWYVVPRNSLYKLTISSTILTKLPSNPFVGCVVQEIRLYLI